MKTGKSAINKTQAIERRSQALQLRLQGLSLRQIGTALGVSASQVGRDLEAVISEKQTRALSEIELSLELELQRLDYYLERLSDAIEAGDTKAISTAVRISERRCKLLGLDAPIRLEVETLVNQELEQLLTLLSQKLPQSEFIRVLEIVSSLQGAKTHA